MNRTVGRETLRVLLVDDNGDDRDEARAALRVGSTRRYEIEEAATGAAAVTRLTDASRPLPDCVVVDFHLPDADALEFIGEVRARATADDQGLTDLPIVVLTGSAGVETNRRVIRAGAQDFVGKDWLSPETLTRAVENAIERQAMARELRHRERDLRASERRVRQLLESMSVQVGVLDAHGSLVDANNVPVPGADEAYRSAVGAPLWESPRWSYDDAVRDRLRAAFTRARAGESVRYDEWVAVGADARVLFDVTLRPVVDDAGELLFVVISGVDVTARRRAEEERQRLLESERIARGEAERANRLKDEFLATLSHELRTPLNAILGWAQMLRLGKLDATSVRRGLDTIERNARVQAQLIEDLLDMSRILSGKLRLDFQPLSLDEVVDASIATMQPAAEAKGVALVRDGRAGERLEVRGDPGRLQQVVWNLVSNAVKFTPRDGRVTVRTTRDGDGEVRVEVTDTGQGIGPDFVNHVFERFRQADASTTRLHGGLGLGLAIVKHLVELHGGRVEARSDGQGQGSTFSVTLPLARARTVVGDTGDAARASNVRHAGDDADALSLPSAHAVDLRGVRVLAVDDDADAREVAARVLSEAGAHVETAANVDEAMARLERPFDVVITDIGMPGRDGFELARWLRRRDGEGPRLPMVALTAFASADDRRRIADEGFCRHLVKPTDPSVLCGVVANLAGRGAPVAGGAAGR